MPRMLWPSAHPSAQNTNVSGQSYTSYRCHPRCSPSDTTVRPASLHSRCVHHRYPLSRCFLFLLQQGSFAYDFIRLTCAALWSAHFSRRPFLGFYHTCCSQPVMQPQCFAYSEPSVLLLHSATADRTIESTLGIYHPIHLYWNSVADSINLLLYPSHKPKVIGVPVAVMVNV